MLLRISLILSVPFTIFACASAGLRAPRPDVPATLCPDEPGGATAQECALRRNAYIAKSIGSTVRVQLISYTPRDGMGGGLGTGVVIDERGTVLTAYHVVKDAEFVLVIPRQAQIGDDSQLRMVDLPPIPMVVTKASPEKDVALLVAKHDVGVIAPPMGLGRGYVPSVGERLWHFGQTTVGARGPITDLSVATLGFTGLVAAQMKSAEGDSGGPVVAPDGTLVGTVIANNESKGLTYFRPIDDSLNALGLGEAASDR